MSNFRTHQRNDAIKWAITAIVFVLIVGVIILGVLSSWFTNWDVSTWGKGESDGVKFTLYEDTAKESPKASVYAAAFDDYLNASKDYSFNIRVDYEDDTTETVTFTDSDSDGVYTSDNSTYTFTLKTDTVVDFTEETGYAVKDGSHLLIFDDFVGTADETVTAAYLVKVAEVKAEATEPGV